MARATTDLPDPVDRAIEVEAIGEASLEAFSRVMAEGWGGELAPIAAANRVISASPASRQRMFLARWEEIRRGARGLLPAHPALVVGQ